MFILGVKKGKIKTKYPIIGHGKQGTIFKIDDNTVLKVYNANGHKNNKKYEFEVAKKMEKLHLNRFVTPFDIRTRNGLLHDFKMNKIDFDHIDVTDLKVREYIDSLREIREDVHKISSVGIKFDDLQEHNICVSKGKITIYDFSGYYIDKNEVESYNNGVINERFGSIYLMKLCKDNHYFIYDNVYVPFIASHYIYFEDYLEDNVKDKNMTVKEYVLSLKNKL